MKETEQLRKLMESVEPVYTPVQEEYDDSSDFTYEIDSLGEHLAEARAITGSSDFFQYLQQLDHNYGTDAFAWGQELHKHLQESQKLLEKLIYMVDEADK